MIYNKEKDLCDDYAFKFLDNVAEPAVQLNAVGKQSRNSSNYFWNNADRRPAFLFQYTLSGTGTLKADDKKLILRKGQAFFLQMPGNECYYFDEEENDAPWEFIYILLGGKSVSEYYKYIVQHIGKVFDLSTFHPAVKLLFDIHCKAKYGQFKNAFSAAGDVFRFLCLLCDPNLNYCHHSDLIEKAKEYLNNNFSKQITLAQTADFLGVSQSHLSREFVKRTGENPIHYLTKVRIENAVDMLVSTDRSLGEISRLCGFSNSNYFCKVFAKYMQTSPGEFRKQTNARGYINVKV